MYKLIKAAEFDPVSLDEFKNHLRITHSAQDLILESKLKAATKVAESFLRRSLADSDWQLNLDSFPESGKCIYVTKCPVTAVEKIEYLDPSGSWQTWSNTLYSVDMDSEPCRIYEKYGKTYPTTQDIRNAVKITMSCGWLTENDIPEDIKGGIYMFASHLFLNTSDVMTGTQVNVVPQASQMLWEPYRIYLFK